MECDQQIQRKVDDVRKGRTDEAQPHLRGGSGQTDGSMHGGRMNLQIPMWIRLDALPMHLAILPVSDILGVCPPCVGAETVDAAKIHLGRRSSKERTVVALALARGMQWTSAVGAYCSRQRTSPMYLSPIFQV